MWRRRGAATVLVPPTSRASNPGAAEGIQMPPRVVHRPTERAQLRGLIGVGRGLTDAQ